MSFKLLPKSTEEFSDTKFWEGFFKNRGSKAFEWYGEYQDMLDLWAQYAKSGDRVLNIGCGNSELGAELHDRQGCEVLCIDTSATVVHQMTRKHCSAGRRPRLTYRVMDAARLEGLEDGSFACAVDKGTLDALMSSATESIACGGVVDGMLAEAHRILRVGGRHLIVSLCQKQVVDKLLHHVTDRPWIARVHQVASAASSDPSGFPLPVFFIALTKLRPGSQTMVQALDAYSTGPPERLDSTARLADWIRRAQLTAYSLARPSSSTKTMASAGGSSETRFAYACGRTGLDAYGCYLLSHAAPSRRRSGYAVFIEPLAAGCHSGAATTLEQRRRLLESQASLRRLLCVRLHPWLYYESDAAMQAALSRLVMAFAPRPGMPESEVPFLSTGRLAYPYKRVERIGQFLAEVSDSGGDNVSCHSELRLICPDSDLAQLQCRASLDKLTRTAPSCHSHAENDSLSLLLTVLLGDVEKSGNSSQTAAAVFGWPCNLDCLIDSHRGGRATLHLPPESATSPLLDQLADRCGLDYRSAESTTPLNRSLVVFFPPAESLSKYTASVSSESLAVVAAAVNSGGRLLVAARLFDRKAPVLEANEAAVAALRDTGRFAEVASATFGLVKTCEDPCDCEAAENDDEPDRGASERLRYWVICASGTAESAERAASLLAGLPCAVVSRQALAE